MTRGERKQLIKALQQFEQAAKEPQGFGDNVLRACADWEIILHKHQHHLSARTLGMLQARAREALNKAMAA